MEKNTKTYTADIDSIFGEDTFDLAIMEQRLPKQVFKAIRATIENGTPFDPIHADVVALAMKDWAVERGATHYTHWFHPLTGSTAEKHESFVTPNLGGGIVAKFSGKDLIQGEPDASSFPNGGIRATFEARGYTAWDPTSPPFIIRNPVGGTLCIPTVFASFTGEALDHKIPLLRSMKAIETQALRALRLFGDDLTGKVSTTVGVEQEYFLVDEEFWHRRLDLMLTGRTLFGAKPPRGQELEDHYFGSIPDRVLECMTEVEYRLYRLGVPVKTRHNEVAPGQYEIAPMFETTNIAADHQQILMQTLRTTTQEYGLVALLHEKPFAGVNGSGKHNNWSMGTDLGANLLEPGDSPHDNMQFLFFCGAVMKAVDKHQDLLRICVASAANDHRLGANEAPPAIISIFLGDELETIFNQLEHGEAQPGERPGLLGLGVDALPPIPLHSGDRNRTSPFAFTGNKFEFRAVGSSQSVSFPNIVLNTIVAEAISEMVESIEARINGGETFEVALLHVLAAAVREHKRILFSGDGYSEEWCQEAAQRGLLNLRDSVEAFDAFVTEKNIALFESQGVLSARELEARGEVFFEQYFKTVNIEAETMASIAERHILPSATRYAGEMAYTVANLKASGIESTGLTATLQRLTARIDEFRVALDALLVCNAELGGDTAHEKSHHMRNNVIPAMQAVRAIGDELEKLVSAQHWTLPTYKELLFVK